MILIPPISDAGLPRIKDLTEKGPFTAFAAGQTEFGGNALVNVKPQIGLGFFGMFPVVGPGHGQHGVDERSVDGDEISGMTIAIGQDPGCFTAKAVVNELELFRPPVVD